MCDGGDKEMCSAIPSISSKNEKCKKCRISPPVVTLRGNDVYCKECFLQNTTHKFRASLGKSKLIRPDDKVLIAFSGGTSSSALLHLVQVGLFQDKHKKLRFDPFVLYVDETPHIKPYVALKEVTERLESTKIPYHVVKLNKSLASDINLNNKHSLTMDDNNLEQNLTSILSKFESDTSRLDFIEKTRYNLYASVALTLSCKYIFLGDTCTTIAARILSNVALGRGAHLPFDAAFADTRFDCVKILRPIKDFVNSEVLYYNLFNDIVPIKRNNKANVSVNSIQNLTEKFVNELQENYPATVYSIVNTGSKLSPHEKLLTQSLCVICNAALDTNVDATSALHATKLSKFMSTVGPSNYSDHSIKVNELQRGRDFGKNVCYGCQLLVKDLSDDDIAELCAQIDNI
uniref:Cytoplasmic tRNA 2-thiolation protein 2 n=1 Tax=Xenopsylla cheopis TaxID=163159 RepID=A0A6M2DQS2_XENCH